VVVVAVSKRVPTQDLPADVKALLVSADLDENEVEEHWLVRVVRCAWPIIHSFRAQVGRSRYLAIRRQTSLRQQMEG
jgi:hypothetical protein